MLITPVISYKCDYAYCPGDSTTIALSKSGAPHGPVAVGLTDSSASFKRPIFSASSYAITPEASK